MEPKKLFLYGVGGLVGFGIFLTVFIAVCLFFLSHDLPNLIEPKDYKPWLTSQIYSSDGVKIGEFLEQRRYLVGPDEIPDLLRKAFVASEDGDFYQHSGISYEGFFRAWPCPLSW